MSDAIKEIAGVLKDALVTPVQEAFVYRARNPFFGTLVIAWFCYNWNKVAYFFLSKDEILERIETIRREFESTYSHSIIFPILWACFMSLAYPFFTYASIWIHKWITGRIETINSQKEIARITLQKELITATVTNELEKIKLQADNELAVEEKKEQAANSRLKVEFLKEQKATIENEIASLEEQKNSAKSTLSSVTSELKMTNEKYNKINLDYEKIVEKHGSFEQLQNIVDLQAMNFDASEKKAKETEKTLQDVRKQNEEQYKASKDRIESLLENVSMLTTEITEKNKELEESKSIIVQYKNKDLESFKVISERKNAINFWFGNIDRGMLKSIEKQGQMTTNLRNTHEKMLKDIKDENNPLFEEMSKSFKLSLSIEETLLSIRKELTQLKEKF